MYTHAGKGDTPHIDIPPIYGVFICKGKNPGFAANSPTKSYSRRPPHYRRT